MTEELLIWAREQLNDAVFHADALGPGNLTSFWEGFWNGRVDAFEGLIRKLEGAPKVEHREGCDGIHGGRDPEGPNLSCLGC